jgi:SWI/SNF-related matrix-associated actin-dependent regulator 1 of chromatin subfamily A
MGGGRFATRRSKLNIQLTWGITRELADGRTVRSAPPTPEFWEVWRARKAAVKAAGFSVSKFEGAWQVSQWTRPDPAEVEATVQASRATDAEIDIPVPDGLSYLPFQKAGISYALGREATLFGDEMGLGKTIQAIGVLNATRPETVLIVCPASLKLNWRNELQRWLTDARRIDIVNGGGHPFPSDPDVVIINYDVLTKHAADLHVRQWGLVIIDEAHYCKNPKAQRTRAALAIQADRKLLLTGTPIPNRPIELQPLAGYLAPEKFGSFFGFAKKYCAATRSRWGWDFSGASNLPELQEQLRSSILVRRLKADVLDELPPKQRQVIVLDGADYQEELRLEALAEAALETTSPEVRFEELSRVRHLLALAKVPAILDHLKGIDHPVVIFAHHKDVIAALAAELDCVTLTGDNTSEERQAAVESFQRGDVQYFIGSLGAAGVGITLTHASHVLFAELDWVPGNLSQAEDRCHRIGQHDSVLVQHLVVDESIDARQVELVVSKQGVLDASLDTVATPRAPEAPTPVVTLQELAGSIPALPKAITVPGLIAAFERVGVDLKRPRITIGALRVKASPTHGNLNPGSLYVERNGEYQGKITADGIFHPTGYAARETAEELLAIDEDPVGQARKHGRLTGQCSICSRLLTDPVSVERGIGPICAGRWGQDSHK